MHNFELIFHRASGIIDITPKQQERIVLNVDTLSLFINKRVKLIDGMSMSKLIDNSGISKAKFYRCLSEPFRFSDSQLELLARELRLSDTDRKCLFAYKYGGEEDDAPPVDAAAEDKEQNNKIISDILRGNIKTGIGHNSRVFKLFHCGDKDAGLQICSAGELIQQLMTFLRTEGTPDPQLTFNATIFNSCSAPATRNLSALLHALGHEKNFLTHYHVNINHLINDSDLEADGRFEALPGLYQLAAVSTFGCYSIQFTNLNDTFLGNTDCCLVHYQDKELKNRYLLINFLRADEVSVYAFRDCNLYSYLSYQYDSITSSMSASIPFRLNSLEISTHLVARSKNHRSTMFIYDLCFDNFVPSLWNTVKQRYLNQPDAVQRILGQADPGGTMIRIDPEHAVDKLIDSFQARFNCCEASGRVTILSAVGLQQFVDTGMTSELAQAGVSFVPEEILAQLEYLYSHIGRDHDQGQSFYLIDINCTPPDLALCVFENSEIGLFFHTNQHTSIFWTMLQQPDIATEFYRYLAVELIDDEKRKCFDSLLYSDDLARAFLQKLIQQVRKRIDAANL